MLTALVQFLQRLVPGRRGLFAAVIGLASCLELVGSATGWAQAPTASAGFVVRIIEGTKAAAPKVDAKLGDLRRELEALHNEFNTFTLLGEHTLRLTAGQRNTLKLPDGGEMALQMLEVVAGPPVRVRHALELPKSRTVRSVARGGRTLDVRPWADKLIIICTSVDK